MRSNDTVVKLLRSSVTVITLTVSDGCMKSSLGVGPGSVYAYLTLSYRIIVVARRFVLSQEDVHVGIVSNSQSMDVDKRGGCRRGELRALSVERGCYVSAKLLFALVDFV